MRAELKILAVGNSFAKDTFWHLPELALALGFERIRIAFLYISGCSIRRHFECAEGDLAAYRYWVNIGDGWAESEGRRIKETVAEEDWDYISIQHGTGDGSRYTLPESYEKLEALVSYIRDAASTKTQIVFNMAWVMAPYRDHPEIRSYGGDQLLMYSKLVHLTRTLVKGTKGIDVISPAGTAIQNARARGFSDDRLMRDGFHLSHGLGRYIASLTFIKELTGIDIDRLSWMPEGVTEEERIIAIAAANAAVANPFEITNI